MTKILQSVDQNGIITAKKGRSTIIYAKYNDEIYAMSVINVLGENMALNKDVSASTETNQWNKIQQVNWLMMVIMIHAGFLKMGHQSLKNKLQLI